MSLSVKSLAKEVCVTQSNDYLQMIEKCQLDLFYEPSSAILHTRLALAYFKLGFFALSMQSCREALKLNSHAIQARMILADLYFKLENFSTALKHYQFILKVNPIHEKSFLRKIRILNWKGKRKELIQQLVGFTKKNPSSYQAFFYLGHIYYQLNQLDKAIEALKSALSIHPFFLKAALLLGKIYELKHKNQEALDLYCIFFEKKCSLPIAERLIEFFFKNKIHYHLSSPLEFYQCQEAVQKFETLISEFSQSDHLLYGLGNLYLQTYQFEKAFLKFECIQPSSLFYVDSVIQATQILRQKNLDEARQYLKNAIQITPHYSEFYFFSAKMEEGKCIFKAIEILKEGVKNGVRKELVREYLANLYDRIKDSSKCLEQMEAILKMNSHHLGALQKIGEILVLRKLHLPRAEKLLKKAAHLNSKNHSIFFSLGKCLFLQGKFKEAILKFKKALALGSQEILIFEYLGDAYRSTGLQEEALIQYHHAENRAILQEDKKTLQEKVKQLQYEVHQRRTSFKEVLSIKKIGSKKSR